MTNAIVGTWKLSDTSSICGLFKKVLKSVTYTFYEDGRGCMNASFVPSNFKWFEKNGEYFIYNEEEEKEFFNFGDLMGGGFSFSFGNKKENRPSFLDEKKLTKFIIKDDVLINCPKNGTSRAFQRA